MTMKISMKKKIVYNTNNSINDMRNMTKTLMNIWMKNVTLNVELISMTRMSKRIMKIRMKKIR